MVKIQLNKEQMIRLKKLGVDTSNSQLEGFTLSELVDIIPKAVYEDEPMIRSELVMKKNEAAWVNRDGITCLKCSGKELIDLVYELLVTGLEGGYIKLNNKE